MRPSDKVRSSKSGKIKLKESYKQAGLTIAQLAAKSNVGEDTIKRLLGTKDCPNGVERWQVTKIAMVRFLADENFNNQILSPIMRSHLQHLI